MKAGIVLFFLFLISVSISSGEKNTDSLEKLVEESLQTKDSLKIYKAYRNLAKFQYHKLEQSYDALENFRNSLKYANTQDSGITFTNIAKVFWRNGNLDHSMKYYRLAYDYGVKVQDLKLQAVALNNIGFLYTELGETLLSLDYHKKALEIRRKNNNLLGVALSYNSISNDYRHLDSLDLAIDYSLKALAIFESLNKQLHVSNAMNSIGNLYFDKKMFDEALRWYKKSKVIRKTINHRYLHLESDKNIAKVFIETRHFNEAENIAIDALRRAEEQDSPKLLKTLHNYLFIIYREKQNYQKALDHYLQFVQIKDSLYSRETRDKIDELEIKFQVKNKEHEIEILTVKDTLNKKEIKQQRARVGFFIILSLLFLVMGTIVTLLFINKIKAYKILLKQNIEIANLQKKLPEDSLIDTYEPAKSSIDIDVSLEKTILTGLVDIIEKNKFYRKKNCSIDALAKKLTTNRQYLSQIINTHYSNNFSSFINQYRIKDARNLLSDQEYDKYTIEAIGKMVGFKSRSAFIIAFKKHTGVTPSDFKKKYTKTIHK